MRTVEDADGNPLVVRKASDDALLVRDPRTGDERYVERVAVTERDDADALETAATAVPPATRRALSAIPDDATLGLLVELVDRDAVAVRDLLADYELCESDLHGRLAEFRAAGLLTETQVAGEPGYAPTALARDAVHDLRTSPDDGGE